MFVLVVVREQRRHGVRAAVQHAARHFFRWTRERVQFELRRVTADLKARCKLASRLTTVTATDHLRHLLHRQAMAIYLLDVLQASHYLTLNVEVDADSVLDAFLDIERLLLQTVQASC